MIETLRQRNFALLWAAGLISILGDWALYAALPVFMYEETGSAFLSGLVWVGITLPAVVVGPIAGVFVDRWDRRRVLLRASLLQAVAVAPLIVLSGGWLVWAVFVVAFADGPLTAVLAPFVDETLGGGPEEFGTLLSIRGVSGVLGTLIVAQLGARLREDRMIGGGVLVVGAGVLAMVVSGSFVVACGVLILLGPAIGALNAGIATLLQRGTDDAVRGRVFGLVGTTMGTLSVLATVGGSALGEATAPAVVVAASGVLYLVTGVVAVSILAAAVAGMSRTASPAVEG